MKIQNPPNANEIRQIVSDRVSVTESAAGNQETVTVEWRGKSIHIPVITMPVDSLHYNPDTHRIRAQRSTNIALERDLLSDPFGVSAQGYLHELLMGDPANPSKRDPSFNALKEDLKEHGQNEPGIITRAGVLINGNTRRAALKEIGEINIRVAVLPADAVHGDLQTIELALQLRKNYQREYSFMNYLLAIEERAASGQSEATILAEFRFKQTTYERCRWILQFVRDAIKRSAVRGVKETLSMGLVHFETDQGKLEELHRAYIAQKAKSSDLAELLREQRLLAIVLDKSKTDLRLIEHDFTEKYMKGVAPTPTAPAPALSIPGTSISVPGASPDVVALRQLVNDALQAKAVIQSPGSATPAEVESAGKLLGKLDEALTKGLDLAGRQVRVQKRRLAAVDRLSDANDDLELATLAVSDARAARNFDADDLEEALITLKHNLVKLSAIVVRGSTGDGDSDGVAWLRAIGVLAEGDR